MPIQQFKQCYSGIPGILKDFSVPSTIPVGETIFDTIEFRCYEATSNTPGPTGSTDYIGTYTDCPECSTAVEGWIFDNCCPGLPPVVLDLQNEKI